MLRPRGSSSSCYETNLGPTVTHTNPLGRAFCQPVSALGRAHDEPKPKAGPEAAGPATGSHATSHPHPAAKGGGSDPSPRTTGSRERGGMTRSEDSCVHGFAIVCVLRSQLLYIQYSTCRGATPGVHRNAEWELLSSRGMTVVYRSMRVKRLARPSMLLPSLPSQLDLSRPGTVPVRRKEWQLGESRSRSSSMMRQKLQGWGSGRGQALSGSVALTMSPIAILVLVFSSGCLFYSVKSHLLPTDNIDYDTGAKSFYIANDTFYKDGSPFRILGGDLHYFRVHPQASPSHSFFLKFIRALAHYWEDRLQRAKALGLNAIQTYVPWNLHQPQPEKLNFEDGANLEGYLKLVQKLGMLVMLRIGPYICAEWDFGGFPAWLLSVRPELSLRTSDPQYLKLVDAWWDVLLPKIVPYLYCHQGPVIMVQIENEYGSFGADRSYMEHLAAKVRAVLGEEIILYTTDGAVSKNLEHGSLEGSGVYTAVDFPTEWDPATAFALQKQYNAQGNSPSLSSEFYTGWLTHWGEQLAQTDPEYTAAALDRILYLNASVVLYMLHGGTNFGFTSGSNTGSSVRDFLPDITSYDYDAPIGEAGDIDNPKFQALKAVLGRYILESPPSPPPLPMRKAFGPLQLHKLSSLFHILEYISTDPSGLHMDQPSSMESVHQISGFILYRTNLPSHAKAGSKISISKDLALPAKNIVVDSSSKPRSFNNSLNHIASAPALDKAIYSASVEESATDFCFFDLQLMVPPSSWKQYPEVDRLVSRQPPQSASEYPVKPDALSTLVNTKPKSRVAFRYLKIYYLLSLLGVIIVSTVD
ncbi:hypothetical protein AXG93_2584s1150 [Marchantia polymorpha subsp. ruderalis]|uniref:beta-galactosidase n=1 Tax=Marchantia polymorpha subsp. ruderalis TaxID=1480154 RepID=A0A176VI88_MARPO|nr:hypothetical protein AXG93_2584s1150 [Marchantia polymorpha subsp. ruderalis]